MIDGMPMHMQVDRHAQSAIERRAHVLFINCHTNQCQVQRTFGGRHIIIRWHGSRPAGHIDGAHLVPDGLVQLRLGADSPPQATFFRGPSG